VPEERTLREKEDAEISDGKSNALLKKEGGNDQTERTWGGMEGTSHRKSPKKGQLGSRICWQGEGSVMKGGNSKGVTPPVEVLGQQGEKNSASTPKVP